MFFTPRRIIGALLLLGVGLAPAQAQTSRYAAADDSPDNSAHALDALSSAAKAPPPQAADVTRGQLAALQSRLDSFMRLSSASTDDNRAALAELRARLDALAQQVNRQQQAPAEDPRVEALTRRLDEDERLIAQLRSGQSAKAAPRPAAPAAPAAAAPAPTAVSDARINCGDLSAGDDAAWTAAVAKAYPGFTLDSVDVSGGEVYVRKQGDFVRSAAVETVMHAVGCS